METQGQVTRGEWENIWPTSNRVSRGGRCVDPMAPGPARVRQHEWLWSRSQPPVLDSSVIPVTWKRRSLTGQLYNERSLRVSLSLWFFSLLVCRASERASFRERREARIRSLRYIFFFFFFFCLLVSFSWLLAELWLSLIPCSCCNVWFWGQLLLKFEFWGLNFVNWVSESVYFGLGGQFWIFREVGFWFWGE